MVAELPTCHHTLHGCAPPCSATVLPRAVISVDPAWKMNTALGSPCASSVTVPVRPSSCCGLVDAGHERLVRPGSSRSVDRRGPPGGVVVRGGQVCLACSATASAAWDPPLSPAGREAGHRRCPGLTPRSPEMIDGRCWSPSSGQHRERGGGAQAHRGLRGMSGRSPAHHHHDHHQPGDHQRRRDRQQRVPGHHHRWSDRHATPRCEPTRYLRGERGMRIARGAGLHEGPSMAQDRAAGGSPSEMIQLEATVRMAQTPRLELFSQRTPLAGS